MDDIRSAFLALNEAILLRAAGAVTEGSDRAEVELDLPLRVRADVEANELVVSQRETGRELYRLPRP